MNPIQDDRPATKTLKLLLKLLATPGRMTRRQLAEYIGLSKNDPKAIKRHLSNIEAAGIHLQRDRHGRYCVLPETGFKELTYLSPLSDEDKAIIRTTLQRGLGSEAKAIALANKLDSLYNFQALGLEALRHPELEKIDAIEAAMKDKKRVILVNYRSRTSNSMRDRKVEAFGIEPEIGMIRAYDTEAGKLRTAHFIISRLDRVEITDESWQYEQEHYHKAADPFNIVMDQRELVHLQLNVGAYNDLVERNPQARQFARPGKEVDTYDWQARVNAKFIGLLPFLLANWRGVKVLGPAALRERIKEELRIMTDSWL
ncbi:MAG: WYL domain-containing transcriptional regulator [Bacteroidota bacterium]